MSTLETPEQVAEPVCVRRGLPLVYGTELVSADRKAIAALCDELAEDAWKARDAARESATRDQHAGEWRAYRAIVAILRGA